MLRRAELITRAKLEMQEGPRSRVGVALNILSHCYFKVMQQRVRYCIEELLA